MIVEPVMMLFYFQKNIEKLIEVWYNNTQDGSRSERRKRQLYITLHWNWQSYEAQAIGRNACGAVYKELKPAPVL
ncbi:MAG: hypothetical protein K2K06_04275 [Oscillospiraceae bacterium]|nr:hypothetical protein [Oscillospiraceae bacterium]